MNRWIFGGGITVAVAGLSAYSLTNQAIQSKQSAIPVEHEQFYQQMVEKAKDLQKQDQPIEAIAQVTGIPTNSKHFPAARSLQESLSKQILDQAQAQHRQGNPAKAIALLKSIPAATSIATTAQALKTTWRLENQHLQAVQKAMESQNWSEAMRHIEQLKGTETFNSPRVQSALQQAINATEPSIVTVRPVVNPAPALVIPQTEMIAASLPPAPPSVAVDSLTALTTTERTLQAAPTAPKLPNRPSVATVSPSVPIREARPDTPIAVAQTPPALVQLQLAQPTIEQRNFSTTRNLTPVRPSAQLIQRLVSPTIANSSPIPAAKTQSLPSQAVQPLTSDPIVATSISEMIGVQAVEPSIVRPSVTSRLQMVRQLTPNSEQRQSLGLNETNLVQDSSNLLSQLPEDTAN